MYDSMENADFEYIYDAYRERSIEIAGTILGNEDEAEDVCQDVFTIIYSMGEEVDFSDRKSLLIILKRHIESTNMPILMQWKM